MIFLFLSLGEVSQTEMNCLFLLTSLTPLILAIRNCLTHGTDLNKDILTDYKNKWMNCWINHLKNYLNKQKQKVFVGYNYEAAKSKFVINAWKLLTMKQILQ